MRQVDHNYVLEKKDVEIGILTRYSKRDLIKVRIIYFGSTVIRSIYNMGDIISGTCIRVVRE